ncbi:CAN5-like protein [Mya arenaria]|uniref:CAN5-like protein n=1 Tax=Mya arenaria TaxID=6604 RepID=A0ABY7G5F4_MYAAR|nr:CAN5-like protein [Mya arenaria]
MSYKDFCQYFTSMEICHIINRSFFSMQKTWKEHEVNGQWCLPDRNEKTGNPSTSLQNPQAIIVDYIFDITRDEDEVMISLQQADRRTDLNRKYRMHDKLDKVVSGPFARSRSVFSRETLSRGRYCIIPSNSEPGHCGENVLRMYARNKLNLTELLHDKPKHGKKSEIAATQITLVKAEDLEPQDGGISGSIEKHYKEDTLNPEWNDRVTLYRKDPYKDVTIEVWNYNIIKDQLMGICTLPMDNPEQYTRGNDIKRYKLYTKGKEGAVQKPGRLWLKVYHTDDMASV